MMTAEPMFKTSKKDKRKIRHAQLLSKISKPSAKPRRRRPSKKLVTTLDSLADALPDETGDRNDGAKFHDQVNIIRRQSVKTKPGALKRREKLDKSERDRFANNMAQMVATGGHGDQRGSANPSDRYIRSEKWATLRGFISQTLEKRSDVQMEGPKDKQQR